MTSVFNIFVAGHFFLNGLLPIYVPVVLYQQGYGLAAISGYVSISALGFLLALRLWQCLFLTQGLRFICGLSFAAQVTLIGFMLGVIVFDSAILFTASALLYGVVNCWLWTSQRVLFVAVLIQNHQPKDHENTGRLIGNFQIFAALTVKLGLLIGAYLLAQNALWGLVLVSLVAAVASSVALMAWTPKQSLLSAHLLRLNTNLVVSDFGWKKILCYKDKYHSNLMFYLDGLFLFAESFFWVISLYLLSQESIQKLSVLLVSLSVTLGLMFWLLKNHIDSLPPQKVYLAAVVGYAVSWLLRANIDNYSHAVTAYVTVLLIAFLSAFFRLSLNKRFIDNAMAGSVLTYLLAKSYASQAGLFLAYVILTVSLYSGWGSAFHLTFLYSGLALVALIYGAYKLNKPNQYSLINKVDTT